MKFHILYKMKIALQLLFSMHKLQILLTDSLQSIFLNSKGPSTSFRE
jgi:hypothetical protein